MPTLTEPTARNSRPIKGTEGRLPAWLEPHRSKLTFFVNVFVRRGWDLNDPKLHEQHIRFSETGVVLVKRQGRELPWNADRLDRLQRLKFWEIVRKWAALEKGNRDKSTKSGRQQSNGHCVHSRQRVANSHNG